MPRKKPEAKITVKGDRGIKIVKACTILRDRQELFEFWRRFENLPHFMKDLLSVTQTSPKESHWIVQSPGRQTIEWDSIIINEHPGELIAWRTKRGAQIEHAGSVRFEPGPDPEATEVTVALEYNPPVGKLAAAVARVFGKEPAWQVEENLMRFKALMETGEIPTTEGQPVGHRNRSHRHESRLLVRSERRSR